MEAVDKFRHLLLSIPFIMVDSKQELVEAQQLLEICRHYLVGLLLESARKSLQKETLDEQKRQAEMAAYFTHCPLQPMHRVLTLRTASNLFWKLKQYKTCASMCRRLLELGPKPDVAATTRKMLSAAEKEPNDPHKLNYDEHNPFELCSQTFKPIYRGRQKINCFFCGAVYSPELTGRLCDACEVAETGKEGTGLRISSFQK